ncbi:MAG: class I SAM-dependent methyltransferase [Planctomycetota bacterium]
MTASAESNGTAQMSETVQTARTARSLSDAAVRVYGSGRSIWHLMNKYRPYICPFELLIEQVPAGSRVLDVGCGTGLFLNLLHAEGRLNEEPGSSTGFDVSSDAVAVGRAAAEKSGHTGISFVQWDAGDAWPTGSFDVVSIVDVMHHLPPTEWPKVIEQSAAALAPGGMLLYKDMCRKPLWRAAANRGHDLVMARQWIRYAPIDDVVGWCEAAGLSVEARGAASRLWYGHEWLVARKPSDDGGAA